MFFFTKKKPEIKEDFFEGFEYPAQSLSAFKFSLDTFTITLKEGGVVHHVPGREIEEPFKDWLLRFNVREV